MLDNFFILLHQWMGASLGFALVGAFLWGLVSVLFSPCHLASIPLIVAYVAGQNKVVEGKEATIYASLFSLGIFVTIAVLGIICTLLGRMLGEIPAFLELVVGVLFVYLGLHLLGVRACRLPSFGGENLKLRGFGGAFIMGLSFGVLSGACTFGFIAPILVMISVQGQMLQGLALLLLFAAGHCLPIVLAGSSAALAQKILHNKNVQNMATLGRKCAGLLVAGVGVYFVIHASLEMFEG